MPLSELDFFQFTHGIIKSLGEHLLFCVSGGT